MHKSISSLVAIAAALVAGHVSAADYQVPRLPDGAPDLQGNWTNASATPFERPRELGMRRGFTVEEAKAIRERELARVAADAKPSDPNAKQEAGALPPVGNYNLFWTERGMDAYLIDGEYRTSIIIDPPDGRMPPRKQAMQAPRRPRAEGMADGPEQRSLGERCILSFGAGIGPVQMPTMYNSNLAIYQSPGYVVILSEMVHDARIVRIGGQHAPSSIKTWLGDSVGRWEGDTLVIETKNFRPEQNFRGFSDNMTVTERIRRVSKDKIVYRFTINDPDVYDAPITGEMAWDAYPYELFEYACHEGNYGLPGILLGEREAEKRRAAEQPKEQQKK